MTPAATAQRRNIQQGGDTSGRACAVQAASTQALTLTSESTNKVKGLFGNGRALEGVGETRRW
ncbi:MAG: hypothetical protein OXI96_01680, partial [Acidimicrobiaceae bacterium]|nr:hypothetical protein [Acidimicrobiaceae bacterium]